MRKFWLYSAVALGVVAVALFAMRGGEKDARGGGAVPVSVVKAYRQEIFDNVEALGTAYANESITVTATASETISEIHFTDGQQVKKGDVIARLEQREEQAQLAVAKARLEEHQRELERIKGLLKGKAASQRDYDERQTLIQIVLREIKGIEARIEDRTLRAPFNGTVGIRRLSVGALVQPGDVITTIDDTSNIKLDFSVPAIHLASLKPGTSIEARTEALQNNVFTGNVEQVDTRVDPVTRSILVRALIPNPEGTIRPGLLMNVILLQNVRTPVVLPEESILQRQTEHFALVVNPETKMVEERRIKTGTRRPGILEVVEGVEEGELVIVRGVGRASPGKPVTIQETWDAARPPKTGETEAAAPTMPDGS
ncbi:MAG: efflux RND transporter periplasmic adaptor subunit [Alphaproteobacteria bacterium]